MTTVAESPGSALGAGSRIEPGEFRRALGHFASGVTVVAGLDEDGAPVGLACQSFTSLSLDPPLVLVCPGRGSTSWPRIATGGRFTVNVLAADQQSVCAALGRPGDRKFDGVPWHRTERGGLALDGAIAWLDCDVADVHDGGDHHIVVGAVRRLAVVRDHPPLLFFRGGYGLPTAE
jgi:3-hydroxy-9,10-secoandrosta-1,3,5(10)-triene-9,17-dione monooxygenase reductase component